MGVETKKKDLGLGFSVLGFRILLQTPIVFSTLEFLILFFKFIKKFYFLNIVLTWKNYFLNIMLMWKIVEVSKASVIYIYR